MARQRRPFADVLDQRIHSCNQLTSILGKLEATAAGADEWSYGNGFSNAWTTGVAGHTRYPALPLKMAVTGAQPSPG